MTLKSAARATFLSVLVLAATPIAGGFAAEWQAQVGRTSAEWLGKKFPAAIERVRKIFPKWSSEEMHGMVVDHIPEILGRIAEALGVDADEAALFVQFVTEESPRGSLDLAALSPRQRRLIEIAQQQYATRCMPYESLSTLFAYVPIPDPPAPGQQIVCAVLHNAAVIARKLP
jgi:hypothetical protein